jgi:hypothetical protein
MRNKEDTWLPVSGFERQVFDEYVISGDLRAAAGFLERRCLWLLATGAAGEVRDAVGRLPAHARSLLLRMADAEAGVRLRYDRNRPTGTSFPIEPAQLHRWTDALAGSLVSWQEEQGARSLAEAWPPRWSEGPPRPEPAGSEQAGQQHAGQQPAGHRHAGPELGRLAGLLSPAPVGYRQVTAGLTAALAQLEAAGLDQESVLWGSIFAFMWSAHTADDLDSTIPAIAAGIDRAVAGGSPYQGWLNGAAAYLNLIYGDLPAARRHCAAAERFALAQPADAPPPLRLTIRLARALDELWAKPGPAALDELGLVASQYRRHSPQMFTVAEVEAATVLLDVGQVEQAAGYIDRIRLVAPIVGQFMADRAAFIATGDPALVGSLGVTLDVLRGSAWGRRATLTRLRVARDFCFRGLDEAARVARADALRELGEDPAGYTRWEAKLLADLDRALADRPSEPAVAPTAEPPGLPAEGPVGRSAVGDPSVVGGPQHGRDTIEVLRPALLVRRQGLVVPLSPGSARLLAVLVAEREPVTVDRLVDLLWPQASLEDGRIRATKALYRLRRQLGPRQEALVARRGSSIQLQTGDRWWVDAWAFWDLATGTGEQRRTALALYSADFCEQQLAYDDAVGEARERLAVRWVDLALEILADDPHALDPVAVARRAERIGVASPRLTRRLADALAASGRPAEALALSAGDAAQA